MSHFDSLTAIASNTRDFLETVWPDWQIEKAKRFGTSLPSVMSYSTCARSSTFLQRVMEELGVAAEVRHGWFRTDASEEPAPRHSWVASGPWYIDVTADQFGAEEILVIEEADNRYQSDIDVAFPEFQLLRLQAVSEIWDRWTRSPMREKLVADLNALRVESDCVQG